MNGLPISLTPPASPTEHSPVSAQEESASDSDPSSPTSPSSTASADVSPSDRRSGHSKSRNLFAKANAKKYLELPTVSERSAIITDPPVNEELDVRPHLTRPASPIPSQLDGRIARSVSFSSQEKQEAQPIQDKPVRPWYVCC